MRNGYEPVDVVRAALSDPSRFCEKRDDYHYDCFPLLAWQTDAVIAGLVENGYEIVRPGRSEGAA